MAESSALVNFLSDPATLVGLGVVAAGAAYYLSSRATPVPPPVPLSNQSTEVPVSSPHRKASVTSNTSSVCSGSSTNCREENELAAPPFKRPTSPYAGPTKMPRPSTSASREGRECPVSACGVGVYPENTLYLSARRQWQMSGVEGWP